MARSFNEKMEKKRQAEYNRWKAECNPVWHRRNHWLPKYEEEGTWEDSRAYNVELGCDLKGYVETVRTYNAAGELIRTEEDLIIQKSCHVIVMVIARIIPVNAECEVFGIWLQLRAVVLRITLSSQMN